MHKIVIRSIFVLILILIFSIIYLSTLGIKTSIFNKLIQGKIIEIDNRISLEIKDVYLKLDLRNKEIIINTNNPKINIKKNLIKLSKINLRLDLFSLLNDKQILKLIFIETKENPIKNVVNFISAYKNNSPLF